MKRKTNTQFRKEARDREISVFNSLSVVSTLAGGTIATLLQMTYNTDKINVATNALLVLSLVLSLATAILCQLANYSVISNWPPPKTRLESLGSTAAFGSPIIFFVSSIIFLFGGLIGFAYTLFSRTAIPVITVTTVTLVLVTMVMAVAKPVYYTFRS